MAINFGLLDTSRPEKIGNSLASMYAQKRQNDAFAIQKEQAGVQNELAKMNLQKGRNDMQEQEAWKNALRGVQGGDYGQAMPQLMQASPQRAMALQKQMTEQQKAKMGISKDQLDMAIARAKAMKDTMPALYQDPSDENAQAVFSQLVKSGVLPPEDAQLGLQKLLEAPDRREFLKFNMMKAEQLLESVKPTQFQREMGAAGMSPQEQEAALRAKIRKDTTHSPSASVTVQNYPNPIPVVGPDDQVVMAQFGNKGDVQVTPYRPYNEKIAGDMSAKSDKRKTILDIVAEAEPLIEKATGSYLGAARDAAMRVAGESTEGAKATARLKVLEGSLMMNQPRMEGPQSDKDVALYRQMAAAIGDPTVPTEEKKAALSTIKAINQRYMGVNKQTAPQAERPPLKSFQR